MTTHILGAGGAMRKVTNTHRVTLMEDCAEEGGRFIEAKAAMDAPDLYSLDRFPRSDEEEVGPSAKVAGVLLAVSIGLVGAFALVAWALEP
jgi:hypothetical protein